MIVYEVSVHIEPALRDAYFAWLRPHVAEILVLPGFTGADMFDVDEPLADDGWIGVCMQFRLVDRAALDAYLRDHAPRLRADGIARFGDRMRAQRRVLAPHGV